MGSNPTATAISPTQTPVRPSWREPAFSLWGEFQLAAFDGVGSCPQQAVDAGTGIEPWAPRIAATARFLVYRQANVVMKAALVRHAALASPYARICLSDFVS